MSNSEPLVEVLVDAGDGGSELSLQDGRYAVVGLGVGRLSVRVPAGLYKLRQRLGNSESTRLLEVEAGTPLRLAVPGLAFDSPIPLPGTNSPREFQQAAFGRTQLTSPGRGAGQFSLLLRDPRWQPGEVADAGRADLFRREGFRLRLESFDGAFKKPLHQLGTMEPGTGFLRVNVELPPGPYVLTQQGGDEGRQRCMSLRVTADWALHAFLQIAPHPGDDPVGLDLDRASLVCAPPGLRLQPDDPGLLLLETARKALARRRFELADAIADRVLDDRRQDNPLLGLFAAHLLLGAGPLDSHRLAGVVDACARWLGEWSPDVFALRAKLADLDMGPLPEGLSAADGPPLLAASWSVLRQVSQQDDLPGSRQLAQGLSKMFPFAVESTSTWFVWTERSGTRVPPALPRSGTATPRLGSGARKFSKMLISERDVEYETEPSRASVLGVVEELLSSEPLRPWVRELKAGERAGGKAPAGFDGLDLGLLAAVSSAQAGLIPGVIDARSAAASIVGGLNVPMATAQQSATRLLGRMRDWADGKDKPPHRKAATPPKG
jgi:hypothetical protein